MQIALNRATVEEEYWMEEKREAFKTKNNGQMKPVKLQTSPVVWKTSDFVVLLKM